MRIEQLFETRVEKTPEMTFLRVSDRRFSYREVTKRAKQYANALEHLGVESGDPVGVFLPNCPEFLFVMLGNAYRDGITAPSNPEYTSGELEHSLSLSRPDLLLTTPELAPVAREAAEGTSVNQILLTEATANHDSLPSLADDYPAAVDTLTTDDRTVGLHIYTSGTTGPPKAVECQHENWTVSAIDFQKRMGFTTQDTLLTALPLFHANAQVYSTLGAAAAGAEVVIYDSFSSSRWWDWCREHGVSEFNAMGSMLKMLDNIPEAEDDADNPVEQVFSAGTPSELIKPFEERFNLRVIEGYSLTEDPMLVLNPREPAKRKLGSIGIPPAEKRVRIVGDDGESIPTGEKGEIVQDSPALMARYHRQPEKTDEVVHDGWFHTGDYGKLDEDGFLYFLDRKKDIVRRGGENISSFEVEGAIKSLDAVDESAVISSPDEFYGEVVKALVRVKDGHDLQPTVVIDACRDNLAPFKIPKYVEFVDGFPYTPTGKIQKQQLRDREVETDPDHWTREED